MKSLKPQRTNVREDLSGEGSAKNRSLFSRHNYRPIQPPSTSMMEPCIYAAALRADAERSESILSRIPAGRWGTPEDFGGPVVFLCSQAADYMHGSVMLVDGGWMGR